RLPDDPRASRLRRRPHRGDRRRPAPQPRRPLQRPCPARPRRSRAPGRTADAAAARIRAARRRAAPAAGGRRPGRRRHHDAAHPARAAGGGLLPVARGVRALLLPHRGGRAAGEAGGHHPASRPAESRSRDRERGRRRALLPHHEPGDQRSRGADGRALSPGRAQHARGRARARAGAGARARARRGARVSDRILVAGGRLVDPIARTVEAEDLLLEGGRIAARGPAGTIRAEAEALDARGFVVLPGLVDMHVHLREPGHEYKETVESGVAAALAGGFTSLACMANTDPVNDSGAVTRFILERAALARGARVHPIGALSVGLAGERLAEIGEMHRAGIVAVSDDGRPVMDAGLMRHALEYARLFGLPVIAHEEDDRLCCGGVMNEGTTALRLGLRGRPAVAEEVMVARDVALAALTGG